MELEPGRSLIEKKEAWNYNLDQEYVQYDLNASAIRAVSMQY
jgi:hypothetical protein